MSSLHRRRNSSASKLARGRLKFNIYIAAGVQKLKYTTHLQDKCDCHSVAVDNDDNVLVEWYDFGEGVTFELVRTITFEVGSRLKLRKALGLPAITSAISVADVLHDRFKSYNDIREFADPMEIPYVKTVDDWP